MLTFQSLETISTGSDRFNELLGGGIALGQLTEICGVPGVGKTQLCIQLCGNVQDMPASPKALYIDTEGSFTVQRAHEMLGKEKLKNIELYRPYSKSELLSLLTLLPNKVQDVKLICIDSISFSFRGSNDMADRTRTLHSIAQTLRRIASQHQIAIVITNQMTTKFSNHNGLGNSIIVPALGESWGHACTNRILLVWKEETRYAWVTKSPFLKEGMEPYCITANGIRDI